MKNIIKILLGMVFIFSLFGCEELWEDIAHNETPEEYLERTQENAWSSDCNMKWFQGRGFNLQLKHVEYKVIDEKTNQVIVNEIRDDIGINFADQMIVEPSDVITVCNMKVLGKFPYDYIQNPIYLNCERQDIYCAGWSNANELSGSVAIGFGYDKKINNNKTHVYSGFVTFGKDMAYDIKDGILMLHEWDQVTNGQFGVSLPLSSAEVQQRVDTGDYELFARDGVVYVKIDNNLYLRRYNSWVYMGIADPVSIGDLVRIQKAMVFEILDWDEIIEPHEYIVEYGNPYEGDGQIYHGDREDLTDITTELMGCK